MFLFYFSLFYFGHDDFVGIGFPASEKGKECVTPSLQAARQKPMALICFSVT